MVLDEIQFDQKNQSSFEVSFERQLAAPRDRLAALAADIVLFLPVVALVAAPFRRQALASQLMGLNREWHLALFSALGISILSIILYQTICISLWGGTPGKQVLGLRVRSIWDDKNPRLILAFIRSIVWCLEVFMLGLPWIAVFGNERRRPFHDRVADTVVVVGLGKRAAAGPPIQAELSLAGGLLTSVLICFGLTILSYFGHLNYFSNATEPKKFIDLEKKGVLCHEVGRAKNDWLVGEGEKKPPRIEIAISLFGAREIDAECLNKEADYFLWRETDQSLSYLAKGLALESNALEAEDQREAYFEKVCQIDSKSSSCNLVKFIRLAENLHSAPTSADEKAQQVEAETEMATMLNSMRDNIKLGKLSHALFNRIWAIQFHSENHNYTQVIDETEGSVPIRQIGHFFNMERAKALWRAERHAEARAIASTATDLFEPDKRTEMAQWWCERETEHGLCSQLSARACGVFTKAAEQQDELLKQADFSLTYIRGNLCLEQQALRTSEQSEQRESLSQLGQKQIKRPEFWTHLEDKIKNREARIFIEALKNLSQNTEENHAHGVQLLEKLAQSVSANSDGEFFFAANQQLAGLAGSMKTLEPVLMNWSRSEQGEMHGELGRALFSRLIEMQEWHKSLEVGLQLLENDQVDSGLRKQMIFAAIHAGQRELASNLASGLIGDGIGSKNSGESGGRQPASEDRAHKGEP
jgi:uncharacterized RDD family membrane protein YckC